jgi:hypothetical protein
MGNALAESVALRSKIALWLLKERFPDWDLALIGVSEAHSVIEALWHGVDERHPLHSHPSSRAAADGVHKVYHAIDRLVGTLTTEFEHATILLFSMHGMGANRSDVPGMVLLPELLHRYAFGRSFFVQPDSWTLADDGVPILREEDNWHVATPDPRRYRSAFGTDWSGAHATKRQAGGKFVPFCKLFYKIATGAPRLDEYVLDTQISAEVKRPRLGAVKIKS